MNFVWRYSEVMTKHMTEQELLYKKLVTNLICVKDVPSKEKNFLLYNFLNQSEYYYDVFCDSIYILMTDDSVETLSLDDTGYARFNFVRLDDFFVGFELLSKKDIASPEDDVVVYINLALERLRNRLYEKSCPFKSVIESFIL